MSGTNPAQSPKQRNKLLAPPPGLVNLPTSPRNSIDGRNGLNFKRTPSIDTNKRPFNEYHFPGQSNSHPSTPSTRTPSISNSVNNSITRSRTNSVNNEYVIDLMEREQDGIVLKLMKEIDQLKLEIKLLKNPASVVKKEDGKKKMKIDSIATLKNEVDSLRKELAIKDTALEDMKKELNKSEEVIQSLKKGNEI